MPIVVLGFVGFSVLIKKKNKRMVNEWGFGTFIMVALIL